MLEFLEKEEDLFKIISKIPGAIASHGECAFGYRFELKDGSFLVIGQTDDDVSDKHLMWFKHYQIDKPVETNSNKIKVNSDESQD